MSAAAGDSLQDAATRLLGGAQDKATFEWIATAVGLLSIAAEGAGAAPEERMSVFFPNSNVERIPDDGARP